MTDKNTFQKVNGYSNNYWGWGGEDKDLLHRINSKNIFVDRSVFFKRDRKNNKVIVGYGAPAKATTALNFFGVSKEIDFIVEDNKLKHNKFVPGVKIPIKNKSHIKNKKNTLIILAWNFYKDIIKNNSELSENFINIKDLESNN